jgi:hypothetical protein
MKEKPLRVRSSQRFSQHASRLETMCMLNLKYYSVILIVKHYKE